MQQHETTARPIHEDYHLHLPDVLRIEMPPRPKVSESDIEAQLFSFIANAPKESHLRCLADLDDAWARELYPGIEGMDELRDVIAEQLAQESTYAYENLKAARVCDALIDCLHGEITADDVEAEYGSMRIQMEREIHANGTSLNQYFLEQDIDEKEFEERIREETKHRIALTVALDLYTSMNDIVVPEDELTTYLMADDPAAFVEEVSRTGKRDEACRAAARIKALRELMDSVAID